MTIKKLPQYVINKLKAGEVVERPASVLKELLENSLDADATEVFVELKKGGKELIKVEDNGKGIGKSDCEFLFERYATSKIEDFEDLSNLNFYGFRGEALSTISEVSKITLITKTKDSPVALKIQKIGGEKKISALPFGKEHGTLVLVEELFYNVPVRKKYLKSDTTEFQYCWEYFVNLSLINFDKKFTLIHNDKLIFDLDKFSLEARIRQIFGEKLSENLEYFENKKGDFEVFGYISNPNIRYHSPENMRIFVNNRFVNDKMIRKAVLMALKNQLHGGEYPFLVLFLNLPAEQVDVNVHPRKLEVKFLNSNAVFEAVFQAVKAVLEKNKITSVSNQIDNLVSNFDLKQQKFQLTTATKEFSNKKLFTQKDFEEKNIFSSGIEGVSGENFFVPEIGDVKIVGQLWNLYIVLETGDALFLVDQHALAERIAFEKMRIDFVGGKSISLLSPVSVKVNFIEEKNLDKLRKIGFEIEFLGENSLVIYKVPQVLEKYKVDLEILIPEILKQKDINIDVVLDKIFATKACKISIKSGEKLSNLQMENLVKEGFKWIKGMFVCQHGRPFFIKFERGKIDKLFDR